MLIWLFLLATFWQKGLNNDCFPENNNATCFSCSSNFYSSGKLYSKQNNSVLRESCIRKNTTFRPERKLLVGFPSNHIECFPRGKNATECSEFYEFLNRFDFFYHNLFDAFVNENSILEEFENSSAYFYVFGETKVYSNTQEYEDDNVHFFRRTLTQIFIMPLICDEGTLFFEICSGYSKLEPKLIFKIEDLPIIFVASLLSIEKINIHFRRLTNKSYIEPFGSLIKIEPLIDRIDFINAKFILKDSKIEDFSNGFGDINFFKLTALGGSVNINSTIIVNWVSDAFFSVINTIDPEYREKEDDILKMMENFKIIDFIKISNVKYLNTIEVFGQGQTYYSFLSIEKFQGEILIQGLEIINVDGISVLKFDNCLKKLIMSNTTIIRCNLSQLLFLSKSSAYIDGLYIDKISSVSTYPIIYILEPEEFEFKNFELMSSLSLYEIGNPLILFESCQNLFIKDNFFFDVEGFKIKTLFSNINFERTHFIKLFYYDFIFTAVHSNSTFDKCDFMEIEGTGVVLNQYGEDLFLLNSKISFVKGLVVINFDELRNNIVANCEIFEINDPKYFWARNLKVVNFTFSNNTFSNSSFLKLLSFYREFSFFPLIIFKDSLFFNLSFSSYGSDYCCLDLLIINVTYRLNFLSKSSQAFLAVEQGGNYAFISTNFIDIGFSEYTVDPMGSYNQATIFLWYPGSFYMIDNKFWFTIILGLRSGFITCKDLKHPIIIKNSEFIVRYPSSRLPVKGIIFNSISQVEIRNCIFVNLTGDFNSLAFTHINGVVSLLGSLSLHEKDTNNNSALFENVTIINVISNNGAGLGVVNYNNLIIKNCSFDNGTALNGLGGLLLVSNVNYLYIVKSNFTNATAFGGGSIYLTVVENAVIESCIFLQCEAYENGGCLSIITSKVNFLDSIFFYSRSYSSGGLLHQNQGTSKFLGVIIAKIESNNGGGVLFLDDVDSFEIISSQLSFITSQGEGGIVYGDSRKFILENLIMDLIEGHGNGAIFHLENFQALIINNSISKNIGCGESCKAGLMFAKTLTSNSFIQIENSLFYNAHSLVGGSLLHINSDTTIKLKYLDISIWVGGSIIYCSGLSYLNSSLENIKISNVICESLSLFFIEKRNSMIRNLDIYNIYRAINIFRFIQSNIILLDISIGGHEISNSSFDYHFFYVESTSLNIKRFSLTNFVFLLSEFLYLVGSEVLLEDLNFLMNTDLNFIVAIDTNLNLSNCNLSIKKQNFDSEKLIESIFYLSKNDGFIKIEHTILSIFHDIFLNAIQSHTVQIVNTTIKSEITKNTPSLIAIYIGKIKYLNVFDSTFVNMKGSFPGVAITFNNLAFYSGKAFINISKSVFRDIQSGNGAVLYFKAMFDIQILNCLFENNLALGSSEKRSRTFGSVCLLLCIENTAGNSLQECLFEINSNNFSKNSAPKNYTTIFSNTKVSMLENSFQHSDLGHLNQFNKIFAYPIQIFLFQNGNKTDNLLIQSGKPENFSILLADSFGEPLSYDSSSVAKIQSPRLENSTVTCPDVFAFSKGGLFEFVGILIKSPSKRYFNFSLDVTFVSDPIDNIRNLNFQLPVEIKSCEEEGYVIQLDYTCHKCERGTFNFGNPNNYIKCEKCLENFECRGGNEVYPLPGFWRETRYDSKVVPCIIKEACLGGNKDNLTETEIDHGACAEGHENNLCFNCKYGFGKTKSLSLCEPCQNQLLILIVRMVLFILLLMLFIGICIYYFSRTQNSNNDIKNKNSQNPLNLVFLKLTLRHIQRLSIISFMEDFSKINSLPDLINLLSFFSFANNDFLSLDCILEQTSSTTLLKSSIIIVFPLILSCLLLIVWLFLGIKFFSTTKTNNISSSSIETPKQKIIRRFLISFALGGYLLYPMILQTTFSLPNCIEFDHGLEAPKKFLFINPNIECWTGFHLYMIIFVFTISILLWSFLFPFYLLKVFQLGKNSNIISNSPNINAKRLEKLFSVIEFKSFRFFYKNYKDERYYWEIIILYEKLILTALASIRNQVGSDLKFLLTYATIIVYLSLAMKNKPFLISKYNTYDLVSGFLTCLFIFSLVIIQKERESSLKIIVFISILLNIVFLIVLTLEGTVSNLLRKWMVARNSPKTPKTSYKKKKLEFDIVKTKRKYTSE